MAKNNISNGEEVSKFFLGSVDAEIVISNKSISRNSLLFYLNDFSHKFRCVYISGCSINKP